MSFQVDGGMIVPAVTADQMREVDRIAVEEFGLGILQMMEDAGLRVTEPVGAGDAIRRARVVVDALIGYSLRGAPRERAAELILACNRHGRVLSLDVPSGLNATTGKAPGAVVRPERTLTLALPKTGLGDMPGDLYLADIGIPPEVYDRIGLSYRSPFVDAGYWMRLLWRRE